MKVDSGYYMLSDFDGMPIITGTLAACREWPSDHGCDPLDFLILPATVNA